MSMKFLYLAGLTASLLAGTAIAQTSMSSSPASDDWMDNGSWYIGAKVGGNLMSDSSHLSGYAQGVKINGQAHYDNGYIGALQGGYAFNNGLRLEIEGADRYNKVTGISPYGTGRGAARNYAAMVNAIYDLNGILPAESGFTPYLGIGIGGSTTSPDHIRGNGMPYPKYFGSQGVGMAYQAIAGVAYKLDDNIDLTLEYRYFDQVNDRPQGISNDYAAHSALIGIRYNFGTPAPVQTAVYTPPAPTRPAPARATPRNYLVFFDFNKSDLTSDARGIVDQAAQNTKTVNVTRLEVTGYTDTVGSDDYNMRLSRRRAESVSAELQAKGVPASEIAVYAMGKHDLLVPTADGVREPQNRRVQIVYSGGPNS